MANLGTQLSEASREAASKLLEARAQGKSNEALGSVYGLTGETIRKARKKTLGRTVLQSILEKEGLDEEQLLERWGSVPKRAQGGPKDRCERLAAFAEMPTAWLVVRSEVERGMAAGLPIILKRAAFAASQLYDCSLEQAVVAAAAAYKDLGPKQDWEPEHWLGPIKVRIPNGSGSGTRAALRLKS